MNRDDDDFMKNADDDIVKKAEITNAILFVIFLLFVIGVAVILK